MAGIMKHVKVNYPEFFRDVADRRNNIDSIRETYADILPQIEADVAEYARENGIQFKFDLA